MQLDDADWPIFGWAADIRPALGEAAREGRPVVLATLIGLDGPAPRPVGTQMLFDGAAATGYFTGGCLEADIANHAAACLRDGEPRYLIYGRGSPWIDIRLTCGGRLEILLERIDPGDSAVAGLLELESCRQLAHWISDGRQRRVAHPNEPSADGFVNPHYSLHYPPRWRLVVVGSDPIALAIAQLAEATGFETLLLRPDRPQSASPFAAIRCLPGATAETWRTLTIDRWTAVVAATHDDALDDEAMRQALHGKAFYAGALGAAARSAGRALRLAEAGLPDDRIASIRSPIGLAGCGKAPREVAVSVIAEILQTRSSPG